MDEKSSEKSRIDIIKKKKDIRAMMKIFFKEHTGSPVQKERDSDICWKLLNLIRSKKEIKMIMFYMNLPEEVNTTETINLLLEMDYLICVPIPDYKSGSMNAFRLKDPTAVSSGRFNIMIPRSSDGSDNGGRCLEKIEPNDIDLVIVPGVAFDKKCKRMGHGYGYYDKYLKMVSCEKIGLAYEFQIVRSIPTEMHDIPVDIVLTERRPLCRKCSYYIIH